MLPLIKADAQHVTRHGTKHGEKLQHLLQEQRLPLAKGSMRTDIALAVPC